MDAHFLIVVLTTSCLLIRSTESQSCLFGPNCIFSCHCKGEHCDPNTGQCPQGCDDGFKSQSSQTAAWSGDACQIGNIAFGKPAAQSGGFEDHIASRAIDGNINTRLDDGGCAHPTSNSKSDPAWLQIDLESTHYIYNVTVFSRECCEDHMWPGNWHVLIGDSPDFHNQAQCAYVQGNVGQVQYISTEKKFDIECSSPMRGQYVTLVKDKNAQHWGDLYVCESLVFGFKIGDVHGMWGPGGLSPCNCEQQCDHAIGKCPSQCSGGWTKNSEGICQIECEDNKWGKDCLQPCNCKDPNEICHKTTGLCSSGCKDGYDGSACQKMLPKLTSPPLLQSVSAEAVEVEFMQWEPPMGGDIPPVSYVIEYRIFGRVAWIEGIHVLHTEDGKSVKHKQQGLQPDTDYEFRVVPVVSSGKSGMPSPLYNHKTPEILITTTPTPTTKLKTTESDPAFSPVDSPSAQGPNKTPMIAGIVVGLVVVAIIVVALVVYFRRFRRTEKREAPKRVRKEDIVHVNALNGNTTVEVEEKPEVKDIKETLIKKNDYVEMEEGIGNKAFIEPFSHRSQEKIAEPTPMPDTSKEPPPLDEDEVYQKVGPVRIHMDDLSSYIEEKKSKKDGFKKEYQHLPLGAIAKWEVGNTSQNKIKNRFVNIRAYDHSRVFLEKEEGDEHSDYINANYIMGYKDNNKHYIACQGPKKQTINDMWRMIWQTNSNRIVAVTNLVELSRTKCEEYWPNIGSSEYGKISVSLISVEKFADFTIRTFAVSKDSQSRTIRQFHFTSWPDHGVPSHGTALLEFRRRVRSYDNQATGPMIVHCSAGIGRTGTFLAIDYLLDQVKAEQEVDVFTFTYIMRRARINMIQTLDQYVFVYDALLEALRSGETAIPCHRFQEVFEELQEPDEAGITKLQEQFEVLQVLKPIKKDEKLAGLDAKNMSRNRDVDIVPSNRVRPFLATRVDGTTDYINAAFIDGYRVRNAYLVTQSPLPNTLADIWRLVYDHRCRTIIVLNNVGEDDNCPVYWPELVEEDGSGAETPPGAGKLTYSPLEVQATNVDTSVEGVTVREFQINNAKKVKDDPVTVKLFHLCVWTSSEALPSAKSALLGLLELVERWQQQTANGPIVTQCFNGASRSGLIVAAMYMLDKLKVDQEVDVFQTVKYVRLNRPQLVDSIDQYRYLHEIAGEYMAKYDLYANFK